MPKLIVVYDDSIKVEGRIKTILGEKSFGEMILKRQSMFARTKKITQSIKDTDIIKIKNLDSLNISSYPPNTIFFHLLSSFAVAKPEDFTLLLEKIIYTKENILVKNFDQSCGAILKDRSEYGRFLNEYQNQKIINLSTANTIETNIFINLANYDSLLMYISSGFDARFFNSLQGDTYTVTKRSADKKKMKKEYSYYWLLPEAMKSWMVMPYNYQETRDWASYTMERMPMTDIAIRWTHGAINLDELRNILEKCFYFFNHREKKQVTKEEYSKNQTSLYIKKLDERIEKLKKLPEYSTIADLIKTGTDFSSIDEIVILYKELYDKTMKKFKPSPVSVISHGDIFFANMLYSKELNLLRFIDPKGALNKDELWMDPYYDIAKLSHSICGNYDFFNTGSYTINFDNNMKFNLVIHHDNTQAKSIFKEFLEKNGYNYEVTRLYESSLFLSMLPLHIDNPHKVFGFILNAIRILKEVKENV